MNCPKCKHEIADNQLRCSFCGVKVKMICPACQAINKFGSEKCSSCGVQLIRYCPDCKAANLPNIKNCRKCGVLLQPEKVVVSKPEELISLTPPENKVEVIRELPKEEVEAENKTVSFSTASEPIIEEKIIEQKAINEVTEDIDIIEPLPEEPKELTLDEILSASAKKLKDQEEQQVQSEVVESTDEVKGQNVESPEITSTEQEKSLFSPQGLGFESLKQNTANESKIEKQPAGEIKYYSQMQAKQKIVSLVKTSAVKHIIALNGGEGTGKSIVFDYVKQDLQQDNIIQLVGKCSPLTQISTYGYFQDMFIRLLSLPAFCADIDSFIKHNKKVFENIFHLLSPEEIIGFVNILYPHKIGKFERIIDNKEKTFNILEKVLDSVAEKNRFIIAIDNFDLIDGISYEFLSYLIDKNYFNEKIKLLVNYKDRKVVQSYFSSSKVDENIYENIYLAKLSEDESNNFIDNFVNNPIESLSYDLRKTIYRNSFGGAAYVEQVMAHLKDVGYLSLQDGKHMFIPNKMPSQLPSGIVEAIHLRLINTNVLPLLLKNILFAAAIMGYKFEVNLLSNALSIADDQFLDAMELLKELHFIVPVNQYSYEFKSLSLWRYIYEEAKNDEFYKDNNEKLFGCLSQFILSATSLKAVLAKNIADSEKALKVWEETSDYAVYTGDINLYVISLKQCLKIIGDNESEETKDLYNEICEKIGKLSYKSAPQEAINYLSTVIAAAKKAEDQVKLVELCSYLVNSCYSEGNFYGVIETVNLVISAVEDKIDDLNLALIKSRKLKALFYIGNCEETINTASNEVIPVLEEALSKPLPDAHFMTMVYESWLESNLMMANAYSIQGNEKAFEVIDNVLEVMQVNKLESKYYRTKADISRALAFTVVGKIKKSFEILDFIANNYKDDLLNSEFLSQWNLIYIINKVLTNQAANLREELFSLATFANNTNDNFSKNVIKTILGYIIQKDGNLAKALEIYNDEITYFAKEKIATGALLGWYLIAQVTLTVEGAERALDIASKALEVAQNPKINNYNFIIYLQKLIAEIYIIKGDLDATKMYLEKSQLIAKQFGLKYAEVEIYRAFGKYHEEFISIKAKEKEKEDNAHSVIKMYNKALAVANELEEEGLIVSINQDKAAFKTYCQLNGISI